MRAGGRAGGYELALCFGRPTLVTAGAMSTHMSTRARTHKPACIVIAPMRQRLCGIYSYGLYSCGLLVMAYAVMASAVMTYAVVACLFMACTVMVSIGMASVVMA